MSRAIDEAVETMRGLRSAGVISAQTLRDFETQALVKAPDSALMTEVGSKVSTGLTWTRDELYDRGLP